MPVACAEGMNAMLRRRCVAAHGKHGAAPPSDRQSPDKFPETAVTLDSPTSASSGAAPEIVMYTSAICGYCVAAKTFLKSQGLDWREVRIDLDVAERERMMARARRTSVPQIFVGETHVGGYDDMMALHRKGGFLPLIQGAGA
jgi:glutaredoxin 3